MCIFPTLVNRRLATAIRTGKLHRGRMIERVMLLDAVLADASCAWLGPGWDKRRHFVRHLENRLDQREYPHLTFGDGPDTTIR